MGFWDEYEHIFTTNEYGPLKDNLEDGTSASEAKRSCDEKPDCTGVYTDGNQYRTRRPSATDGDAAVVGKTERDGTYRFEFYAKKSAFEGMCKNNGQRTLYVSELPETCAAYVPGYTFEHKSYWDGSVVHDATTSSVQECADVCSANSLCQAFSRRNNGVCYLYEESEWTVNPNFSDAESYRRIISCTSCEDDADCISNNCRRGRCRPHDSEINRPSGTFCEKNEHCASNQCRKKICAGVAASVLIGETCNHNDECVSGWCPETTDKKNTCQNVQPGEGEYCETRRHKTTRLADTYFQRPDDVNRDHYLGDAGNCDPKVHVCKDNACVPRGQDCVAGWQRNEFDNWPDGDGWQEDPSKPDTCKELHAKRAWVVLTQPGPGGQKCKNPDGTWARHT